MKMEIKCGKKYIFAVINRKGEIKDIVKAQILGSVTDIGIGLVTNKGIFDSTQLFLKESIYTDALGYSINVNMPVVLNLDNFNYEVAYYKGILPYRHIAVFEGTKGNYIPIDIGELHNIIHQNFDQFRNIDLNILANDYEILFEDKDDDELQK